MNSSWKDVVDFYRTNLRVPETVVNYLAVYDILEASCTGVSNEDIAGEMSVEVKYVKDTLIEFLNFRGWDKTLDISPLFVYNKTKGIKELYWAAVMAIPDIMPKSYVDKSFTICKRFIKIERTIDKYYG